MHPFPFVRQLVLKTLIEKKHFRFWNTRSINTIFSLTMAFDKNVMEKILTDEIYSPDFLLRKSDELLLFKDVEEWYAVASLLIRDDQVSIMYY